MLALYFMPGTLLRVFRLPLFELTYKFSPFLIWKFTKIVLTHNPKSVLFSHHAIFYLSFFYKRDKTHYVIHDLLYRRARSLGFGRRLSKFVFWVELHLYSRAASLLCLSFQEKRILASFGFKRLQLLSSYDLDCEIYPPKSYDSSCVALVSDWRRPENIHGAIAFFSKTVPKKLEIAPIAPTIKVYGFGSSLASSAIESIPEVGSRFTMEDIGFYKNHSDITEGLFLVPIYQGAGIKIKVLEALRHRRYVLGTAGAFEGLPRRWLTNVSTIVTTLSDMSNGIVEVNLAAFNDFEASYKKHFKELGSICFK